jgi:hypothetical protein
MEDLNVSGHLYMTFTLDYTNMKLVCSSQVKDSLDESPVTLQSSDHRNFSSFKPQIKKTSD